MASEKTVTRDEVIDIVKATMQEMMVPIRELIEMVRPKEPTFLSEDERVRQIERQMKGLERPCPRERCIPVKSDLSAATFLARVIESRSFPDGRIVELLEYKYPEGIDKHVSEGGLVPERLEMFRRDNGHPLMPYRKWLWEEFWRKDLDGYVGKPWQRRYAADPDSNVPWTTPKPAQAA